MNFAIYTANTIPALEIHQEDAEFWAELISETHMPLLHVSTSEPLTIEEIVQKYTEYKWQEGVWNGEFIAGPLMSGGKDTVSTKGISLYAIRQ